MAAGDEAMAPIAHLLRVLTSPAVCTENPIGVDDVTESPKLGE